MAPLIEDRPLQHGLAELIGYLSLTDASFDVVFDDERRDEIGWVDDDAERRADLPAVTFTRSSPEGAP